MVFRIIRSPRKTMPKWYIASSDEEEGWVTFDGNQYGFFDHEASFDEAEEICVHYGGHLVSIHSQAENDFVHSMTYPLTSHSYNEMVWLGGRRASPPFDNQWTWTDGSPFDYTNWDDGEPDYYQAIEKCLQESCRLPKRKRTRMAICTYNVRTLASEAAIEDLMMQAKKIK
ncbi:hypothetical protein RB195_013596 [Necator americanus]|uniref:C-type lectin domain-containing protein n=1 Tax=Necator americanus TaxID=51031 RepID=A0ABR1DWD5_NECAM